MAFEPELQRVVPVLPVCCKPAPLAIHRDQVWPRLRVLRKPPDNDTLLALYALYKQASAGDVTGDRPGALDMVGRAKYDTWAKKKGLGRDAAMQAYVQLVDDLKRRESVSA